MDLNKIKEKLANLQSKPGNKETPEEKAKREKNFWTPPVGKAIIRIVPSKFDKSNPFQEVYFHYNISNRPLLSLTNFEGEKDPINEFSKQLKDIKTGDKEKDKSNWILGRKLEPKMRTYVPVIVRGEEEKGVRYWAFGPTIYQTLLALTEDEDIADYTDIAEGRDLTITTIDKSVTGTGFNKTTPTIKPNASPLSKDKNQVKAWITDQVELLSLFERLEYDYIKQQLSNWLNAGGATESSKDSKAESSTKTKASADVELQVKQPVAVIEEDELDKLFKEK